MAKKNALGRGLGALIEDAPQKTISTTTTTNVSELINEIDVKDIISNPYQPRTKFDEETLNELAASIKELGLIQPITVNKLKDGTLQLISGERRLKAAKIAGIKRLPAYIRTVDNQNLLEMALVENIQREDLDSIEIAISFQQLIEECKLTQETLSERVGKKRSTVANYLRLLKLPAEIQLGLREKRITMGHAKALINIENPNILQRTYKNVVNNELSVRKTEDLVKSLQEKSNNSKSEKSIVEKSASKEYTAISNKLKQTFKKIELQKTAEGKGKIVISFNTDAELQKIISVFDKIKS